MTRGEMFCARQSCANYVLVCCTQPADTNARDLLMEMYPYKCCVVRGKAIFFQTPILPERSMLLSLQS